MGPRCFVDNDDDDDNCEYDYDYDVNVNVDTRVGVDRTLIEWQRVNTSVAGIAAVALATRFQSSIPRPRSLTERIGTRWRRRQVTASGPSDGWRLNEW